MKSLIYTHYLYLLVLLFSVISCADLYDDSLDANGKLRPLEPQELYDSPDATLYSDLVDAYVFQAGDFQTDSENLSFDQTFIFDEGIDDEGIYVEEILDEGIQDPILEIDQSLANETIVECEVNGRFGECMEITACLGTAIAGYCPGPASIQCCIEDFSSAPTNDCLESPSWDQMPRPNEGLSETYGDIGCPNGMARIDHYCVDRYEASLIEILPNGTERSWSPFFNPEQRNVYAVAISRAVPQGYISGAQAQQACQAAGKRLCSNQEWLRACSSSASYTFPYGNIREWGLCNDSRSVHPAVSYFGSSGDHIWNMLSHPCINQQENSLGANDDYLSCVSSEGIYNMVGNLHEWTSDPNGTFRGGFYADTSRNGQGCSYRTTAHSFGYSDYSTGFRCCADAR